MNKYWIYVLLSLSTYGLQSCSLTKGLPYFKRKPKSIDSSRLVVLAPAPLLFPAPDTAGILPDTTGNAAKLMASVQPLWHLKRLYTTFAGKSKIHFESPGDDQEFSANIRLKKDSAIWVDITAVGGVIHAARVYITADSCFMINYLQKSATKLPLAEVARILPTKVDFNSLQNLITGAPLREGNITGITELTNTWVLNTDDGSYEQQVGYTKADSTLTANLVTAKGSDAVQALITYLKYEMKGNQPFSMLRNIAIKNNADKYQLEIELQSADFNGPVEMPFSIPKNYSLK